MVSAILPHQIWQHCTERTQGTASTTYFDPIVDGTLVQCSCTYSPTWICMQFTQWVRDCEFKAIRKMVWEGQPRNFQPFEVAKYFPTIKDLILVYEDFQSRPESKSSNLIEIEHTDPVWACQKLPDGTQLRLNEAWFQ